MSVQAPGANLFQEELREHLAEWFPDMRAP